MALSQIPPKGTADWLPEEFEIRKYIFDTWRKVCEQFGYQEYLTPIFEYADLYRAKSGEDVGGKELLVVTDRGGRELAIRPEMTPSVTRLVSRIYRNSPKPLRLFSIANFFRNEKPQRGRNREFWQLNFDIFGSSSLAADVEVLELGLRILQQFGPPPGAFTLQVNSRKLINYVLTEGTGIPEKAIIEVARLMDKWLKLEREVFLEKTAALGLTPEQSDSIIRFMESESLEALREALPGIQESEGYKEILFVLQQLEERGLKEVTQFAPQIIRGFDYYDGTVFEVFDNHPDNRRAMFGGGRYNGLASVFGSQRFPAVGSAPGDEPAKLFIESWGLLPFQPGERRNWTYLPVLEEGILSTCARLAQALREKGQAIRLGSEKEKIGKALEYANKANASQVILLGERELQEGVYLVKDLSQGTQEKFSLPWRE